MARRVVVGTRGSELALKQSESLVEHLQNSGFEVEWRQFTTHGDRWQAGPLDKAAGTGFFTKELEAALQAAEVDLLIHSLKDVSLERPEGILTACIPEREDPSDWLVLRADRPEKPMIGTSSVRRERMLRAAYPEADFTWIRGNVPKRLQRVRDGVLREAPLHGTLLAAAGLRRLGLDLSGLEVRPVPFEHLLPAPGQGALLAETRVGREDIVEALSSLHHLPTVRAVALERGVLAGIGGGCQQPLGAFAEPQADGGIRLRACFAGEDGIRWADAQGQEDAAVLASVIGQLGF